MHSNRTFVIKETYKVIGNDGNHYDKAINIAPNTAVSLSNGLIKENQSLSVEELKCNAKWLTSVRILCDTDLDLDISNFDWENLL